MRVASPNGRTFRRTLQRAVAVPAQADSHCIGYATKGRKEIARTCCTQAKKGSSDVGPLSGGHSSNGCARLRTSIRVSLIPLLLITGQKGVTVEHRRSVRIPFERGWIGVPPGDRVVVEGGVLQPHQCANIRGTHQRTGDTVTNEFVSLQHHLSSVRSINLVTALVVGEGAACSNHLVVAAAYSMKGCT